MTIASQCIAHVLPLVVLGAGVLVVGRAILTLKTNSLVDEEMAEARVAGSGDGKANDDTYQYP